MFLLLVGQDYAGRRFLKKGAKSSKSSDKKCSADTIDKCCEPPKVPGIAIVRICGINGDCKDKNNNTSNNLDFVALDLIPKGTKIYFTDYGWENDNEGFITSYSSDARVEWEAPDDILPGQVQTVPVPNLNSNGDQIFAFQGSIDNPTFLYGINWNGVETWQDNANDNLSSSLPSQLDGTNKEAAIGDGMANGNVGSNYKYEGIRTGAKEDILDAI